MNKAGFLDSELKKPFKHSCIKVDKDGKNIRDEMVRLDEI